MHIFITYIPVFFFEIYGFLDFCQYGNLTDLPKFIQIFVLFWNNWNQI
jgi:hypothetical protein